jgi:inositol phosphorylceramide mannosyltransferase catalytic subunit
VPLYEAYPEAIQRVDAARYVILREFGGVYADLDLQCLRPIDALLDAEVVLPRTTPFGVSNQFMLSVKGHSLFSHAIASLPAAYAKWGRVWPRHLRVLTTAGPLFLTGRLREHGTKEGMRILSLDEHGHGEREVSYVAHLRGNTWAAWDTHVINFFHDNWKWLVAGVVASAVLLLTLL